MALVRNLLAVFLTTTIQAVHGSLHADDSKLIVTTPTFSPNSTGAKCGDAWVQMTGTADCIPRFVPMAVALSGGQCLSLVMQSGWYRSEILNPEVSSLVAADRSNGAEPLVTATNSGGSMFWTRMLALRNYKSATKWTYPCYMLDVSYRNLCNFHGTFGGISGICDVESWQVVSVAVSLVYTTLINTYGGPMGSGGTYAFVYFPFIHNLPLTDAEKGSLPVFSLKFVPWSTLYDAPSNWIPSVTHVSPTEASRGVSPYNYGFLSYLPRGLASYWIEDQQCSAKGSHGRCEVMWCLNCRWWSNSSLGKIDAWSASSVPGLNLMVFSWSGKAWDPVTGGTLAVTTTLKVFSIAVTYVMTQRLLAKRTLANAGAAPYCESGCPVFDGVQSDNGPTTETLSYISTVPRNIRPALLFLNGPASTFEMYNFQLGKGYFPMHASLNFCPFDRPEICETLGKIRDLMVDSLDAQSGQEYRLLKNTLDWNSPENQVLMPFCGDPLAYDVFHTSCQAQSVCSLQATVVPSEKMAIAYTIELAHVVMVVTYLGPTPLAQSYVHEYIPKETTSLPYFSNMHKWFPAYGFTDPNRGTGGAWTKVAGHSLMDYMTFLSQRIAGFFYIRKKLAWKMYVGEPMYCSYRLYTHLQSHSRNELSFSEVSDTSD